MKTSGRLYADKLEYLLSQTSRLSDVISTTQKDPVDATWGDAGTINYVSKLVDKAILELDSL